MKLANLKYCSHCGSDIVLKIPEGDNRERAVCSNCGFIFYDNPKIVVGCILEWKNKILMCKRATEPRSDYWTLPAGFLENNETTEEGALRETFEEAGAKAEQLKPFLLCNLPRISQIYMIFHGNLVDGKFSPGLESSEVKLFSKNEIPWDEIAFLVITRTIKLYYQDLKNDTMKMHFETIDKNL